MKRFILAIGLVGAIASGAVADTGLGNRTVSKSFVVDIATYMNISPLTGGNFSYSVTDGGFQATYNNGSPASFTVTSNVNYGLTSSVTGTAGYTFYTNLDSAGFTSVSNHYANSNGDSVPHSVDVELLGNTSIGLPPTPSTVTGTLTVTFVANT